MRLIRYGDKGREKPGIEIDGIRFDCSKMFKDWVALLLFRDSKAPRESRVTFMISTGVRNTDDAVSFTFDEVSGQDFQLFEKKHQKPYDGHFMRGQDPCWEATKNFVFFRPRNGNFKIASIF